VVTLAISALPGYRTWGIAAVVLLIVLRFVDGIFLGGEYTSATVLALENAPRRKRGLYGAFIMTGYPVAYCVIALITLGLLAVLPADGPGSPYVEWGWRIPFAIGALISFAFVAWYTYAVKESESWKNAEKTRTPLADMFRGRGLRTFLQVFVLMTGIWFVQNAVSSILPEQLLDPIGLDSVDVKIVQIVSYAVLAAGYVGAGVLSQRIGRRPFFLIASVTIAVPAAAVYGLLVGGAITGLAPIVIAVIAVNLLTLSVWGVATTYLNERFHVGVRSTGYGIGYSFAVVIPAFYAFYQSGLAALMPATYTPLVLIVLAGVLIGIGAKLSPETRDAEM
jgi:MFS family permease